MTRVSSFDPVVGGSPGVLVLGSMPGRVSLEASKYYAYPRNSFWPIMGSIVGFDPSAPYEERLEALVTAGIALWDVLHSCVRPGSADSAIQAGTRTANDFRTFFRRYPDIRLVCFNGAEAEKSYRIHVLPGLSGREIDQVRLPSTSPAYAALSLELKLAAWRRAIAAHLAATPQINGPVRSGPL